MAQFFSSTKTTLGEACHNFLSQLSAMGGPTESCSWHYELSTFDETRFLTAVSGVVRVAFKSRDRDLELFGLGAADVISRDNFGASALSKAISQATSPSSSHTYFTATKFDVEAHSAPEWRAFAAEQFILPMLLVKKHQNSIMLQMNFRANASVSWPMWRDHITTLAQALMGACISGDKRVDYSTQGYVPTREVYYHTINQALDALNQDSQRKVVLGRRKSLALTQHIDPAWLYFRLKQRASEAFVFFFDTGQGSAFFGASPELLYRRLGLHIETESLAGTRARSPDYALDNQLGQDLLASAKDNQEHSLVSLHIENTLKSFGVSDICASKLSIMPLSYVQHLVKRYSGRISDTVNDADIITALHPTPAVCGLDRTWALEFIRAHEGFDRGLYAGLIGYFGHDEAELAVAIRSALIHQQTLFIYAASGIVSASIGEAEWAELDNKEKSILEILCSAPLTL